MGNLVSPLEQQFRDIPETELVAQPPEDGEQHDVSGELEIVEAGAGPLVEDAPARVAGKCSKAE